MREINDWMLFNDIVYKIYTTKDNHEMRKNFLNELSMLIDFDAADFYLAKQGDERGLISPVLYNCDGIYSGRFDELDYSRGILYSGECRVYRETDIISDEIRVNTEYYNRLYRPNRWHYSAQMILASEKEFVGVVTLYRKTGKENFHHEDIMILDMLKNHLAFKLQYEKDKDGDAASKIDNFSEKHSLTKREETVLRLLWDGKNNQEISDELVISIHTLKKHILNIYRKSDVNNRGELINKVAKWSIQ
jgi:DNA-binding CsgD family transcriptional regulator